MARVRVPHCKHKEIELCSRLKSRVKLNSYLWPMITNTSILILNDFYEKNIPVITDSTGKAEYAGRDFNFHSGFRTEVSNSCSVAFRGEFYVFGGDWNGHNEQHMKQILKVTDCSLEKIGKLRFKFRYGACAAVNEESIYLCFSDRGGETKQCYVGADPVGSFSEINQSQFNHDYTRVAAGEGNYSGFGNFHFVSGGAKKIEIISGSAIFSRGKS